MQVVGEAENTVDVHKRKRCTSRVLDGCPAIAMARRRSENHVRCWDSEQ